MMNKQKAICNACTVGHGCKCPDSPHDGCKREAVVCIRRKKVKEKVKMEREQLKQQVHNTICGANREASREATIEINVVKKPDHYRHGAFEVIDEMLIVFGVEQTLVFCRLNAWKYRARAPYKGTFEQDMDKANSYLIVTGKHNQHFIKIGRAHV